MNKMWLCLKDRVNKLYLKYILDSILDKYF